MEGGIVPSPRGELCRCSVPLMGSGGGNVVGRESSVGNDGRTGKGEAAISPTVAKLRAR